MKRIKFVLIALFAMASISSCTRITPKEEGFRIYNSGDYRGIDSLPLLTGWQFYLPGHSYVAAVSTTIQHIVWSENEQEGSQPNEHITISCYGGSGFKVDVGLNYHVTPGCGSKVWLKYKTDDLDYITTTYLRNTVRKAMQDESGIITVDSLLNGLPAYENAVTADLEKKFKSIGLTLDNFNVLSKPRPDDEALAKAINQKIIAKQNAETSKQQLEQSIAEANKKIAAARGDSAEAVIKAAGQAEAINKLQQHLTPEYIEYVRIQKWSGQYPTTMLGNGSGVLMNLK